MKISIDKTRFALHKVNRNDSFQYRKQITLASASVICLVLNYILLYIAKTNQTFIEFSYSRGFYDQYSSLLNRLNKWFPFSLSEIFYMVMILMTMFLVLYALKELFVKKFKSFLTAILIVILIISGNIVYYQISWGLNNYRYDVETLFELEDRIIDVDDLAKAYKYLVLQSNKYKEMSERSALPSRKTIMKNAYLGYNKLNVYYDFINNDKVRVKPLLISPIFSSSGYTGIYLPLFSEANINQMPHISGLGFTASHELAHQKGFASEDEANFVGFLASSYHDDPYYRYSGYQAMMVYIGNSLYKTDQELYLDISELRSDEVIEDMISKRDFWDNYIKETTRKVHNNVNDAFLKANNQPDGIVNYSKVTELFIKAFSQGYFESL